MDNPSERRRRRAESVSPVQIGELVAGKYRVERIIAAGGMGIVVSARHEVLKQTVAIKFLIPESMEDTMVARFLREAKASARIQSERVVRVHDCGMLDSGVPYMVMEHLVGTDLAQHLREHGPMAADEAVDLMCSALEGVAEAHALGIIHRDLKPANLYLVGRPQRPYSVKVLDFGISKIQPGPDSPIEDDVTATSMMLGSPRYISPEQARSSRDVDVRADVWSVGVILYELLDGACPFAGNTIGEALSKILIHDPPPIDAKRTDVDAKLGQVIAKCIERDPADRFPNVLELARALAPFGSELAGFQLQRIERIFELPHEPMAAELLPAGWAQPASGHTGPRAQPTVLTTGSVRATETSGQRSSRRRVVLCGAVATLAAGVMAGWFIVGRPGTRDVGTGPSAADTTATASQRSPDLQPEASSVGEPKPAPVLDGTTTSSAPVSQPSASQTRSGALGRGRPGGAGGTAAPSTTPMKTAGPASPVSSTTRKAVLDTSD